MDQTVNMEPYLIFVISFTQAGFLNSKVLHPKTTQNTHKLQQIPQKDVKYAVICVQSGKIYTGQNFFTRAPPVVPVTNMRYEPTFSWKDALGALFPHIVDSRLAPPR